MKRLAAIGLVLCVSCAPVAQMYGGVPPERLTFAPVGYYEDGPEAPRVALGVTLTCGIIAGFVIFWPDIEGLFTSQFSTWFYGY